MGLWEIKKTLFDTKTTVEEITPVQGEVDRRITYYEWGKKQAESLGGSSSIIQPALQAIYIEVTKRIKDDKAEQEKRKIPIKNKIDIIEAEINALDIQITKKTKDLEHEESKIETNKSKIENYNKDITNIKNNPSIVTKEKSAKAGFIMGLSIILLLTIYLFVFYSSAAFSAFFKNFNLNELGIANAMFDGQAINKALNDGFFEFILIITIPAVFLGLGFLIHKFAEEKGFMKVLKIFSLMVITFIFDAILAYEITEKIYNIKSEGTFSEPIPYSFKMAIESVSFWLIIFSGFIVYVIWGFVFDFVMKEYYNLDKVRVAINELNKRIQELNIKNDGYKLECKTIKESLKVLCQDKEMKNGLIKQKKAELDSIIISLSDVQLEINNFVNGWLSYMEFRNLPKNDREQCLIERDRFIASVMSNIKD